jgi:hypothetical protein
VSRLGPLERGVVALVLLGLAAYAGVALFGSGKARARAPLHHLARPQASQAAAPSGWQVVPGTKVVVSFGGDGPAHSSAVVAAEEAASAFVTRWLSAAWLAPGRTPSVAAAGAWSEEGLIDPASPYREALLAGPESTDWSGSWPEQSDGAGVAFDLRVLLWRGGTSMLGAWGSATLSGPWLADLPSAQRRAYFDLGPNKALLAAFMPYAVELGAGLGTGAAAVAEHWVIAGWAELRPAPRTGALSLYSPLARAWVWAERTPSLVEAPSYVTSMASWSVPAGATAVAQG